MDPFKNLEQSLKAFIERQDRQRNESDARLLALEQKAVAERGGGSYSSYEQSLADTLMSSDQFKSFISTKARNSGAIEVGSFHKNLVNTTSSINSPVMVAGDRRAGFIAPGVQRLTVRDLLAKTRTNSLLVEYVKESSFTNNAAIQAAEGDPKGESAMGFTLSTAQVRTLAHYLPASRQVLDDAAALQAYLNTRLLYGLKQKEEQELLNGSGAGSEISGLITNATTYDTNRTTVATDTFADILSHAMQQVRDSFYEPDGIVLHPKDWEKVKLIKSNTGEYVFSSPYGLVADRLWGVPVVPTSAIAESQFLVGAFQMGAMIWDRQDATVEISREHDDFFTRNLVAILCEERLALTVFQSLAFVYGGFPYGS